MTFGSSLLALGIALLAQVALGRIWPESQRYVDALLVPVVWAGLNGSQRSAMFVGCSAGLLKDAWFLVGAFGVNGFKRTLLGWGLGGIAARLDLNHPPGRMVAGVVVSLADSVLDLFLRGLLDQKAAAQGVLEVVIRAVVTGLLVVLTGTIVDRMKGRHGLSR